MGSSSVARRKQRGGVWLETLLLTALVLAVGVALRGFGGTLAQSFACAAYHIQTWSENACPGSPARAGARAVSKIALGATAERQRPVAPVPHERVEPSRAQSLLARIRPHPQPAPLFPPQVSQSTGVGPATHRGASDDAAGQDRPTAEELFRDWQSRWHRRHNAAVKSEREVRQQLWSKGAVEFANNWNLFKDGQSDALGTEYEEAARELGITSSMLRVEADLISRLEDKVDTLRQPLTPAAIDDLAAEMARVQFWVDLYASDVLPGGAATSGRGGDPSRRPNLDQRLLPRPREQASANSPSTIGEESTASQRSLAFGGTKSGPGVRNPYNPCGLSDNCGYSVISHALEYQSLGKIRSATELYAQQRQTLGLAGNDALPKRLVFPGRTAQEIDDLAKARPTEYKALFDSNKTLADYTIDSVAEMNGLSVRPARHALDEWRRAFRPKNDGGVASLDEAVDASHVEAVDRRGARAPSKGVVRDRVETERKKLPGLYIIGSRSRSHFMTMRIHEDGQITGFDPQNGARYRGLEEVRGPMGGDPDLILFVSPPTRPVAR